PRRDPGRHALLAPQGPGVVPDHHGPVAPGPARRRLRAGPRRRRPRPGGGHHGRDRGRLLRPRRQGAGAHAGTGLGPVRPPLRAPLRLDRRELLQHLVGRQRQELRVLLLEGHRAEERLRLVQPAVAAALLPDAVDLLLHHPPHRPFGDPAPPGPPARERSSGLGRSPRTASNGTRATGTRSGWATHVPSKPAFASRSLSSVTLASATWLTASSRREGMKAAIPPMAWAPRR